MYNIKTQIQSYLDSKKLAWAATTLKSEQARLGAVVETLEVVGLNPAALFKALEATHKPYTIKTIFVRLAAFETETMGTVAFRNFVKTHSRLFRNSYIKERLELTLEDAISRIKSIEDTAIRTKAFELLYSGMRYTESTTEQRGLVVGKGGKVRTVFKPVQQAEVKFEGSYTTFWRTLKKVGLKPHTLRKLRATNLVDQGASMADLMEIMGWSSMVTASSYLQPKRQEQLNALMQQGKVV